MRYLKITLLMLATLGMSGDYRHPRIVEVFKFCQVRYRSEATLVVKKTNSIVDFDICVFIVPHCYEAGNRKIFFDKYANMEAHVSSSPIICK